MSIQHLAHNAVECTMQWTPH